MEKKEFSPLYVTRLSTDNVYGLLHSTVALGTNAKNDLNPVSAAILAQMVVDKDELSASIKKTTGSTLTPQLNEADHTRDQEFNAIKRAVVYYSKEADAAKKEAALALKQFLTPFWDVAAKAMDVETTLLADLLTRYKADAGLQTKAAAIGVDARLARLETLNNQFDALWKSRITEKAQNTGVAASRLRTGIYWVYERFCTSVELAATFAPTDGLLQLFNEMDAVRKKYSLLVPQQSSGNTGTPDETAGNQ